MARVNRKATHEQKYTHGGAPAFSHLDPIQQLRRSVLACFLWEDGFYEDGVSIAERIQEEAKLVTPEQLAELAIRARSDFHLRHVPLWLLTALIKRGGGRDDGLVRKTIAETIQRPDELAELLAMYWKDGRRPLSGQMKKGLAAAFQKFNQGALSKWNRDHQVKLRDVLFLSHAKGRDVGHQAALDRLANQTLEPAETWEHLLSSGGDKKATFTRLIKEGKLGYFALIRNLRNMLDAGVDQKLVKEAILARGHGAERILPFRFIAAALAAPTFEKELDQAMQDNVAHKILPGKTVIVVDISGSMGSGISNHSVMDRMHQACAMAVVGNAMAQQPVVYATAGDDGQRKHATALVPPRNGMALVDAIRAKRSVLGHGGIFLTPAMEYIRKAEGDAARTIVITDEQDCSGAGPHSPDKAIPLGKGYMINVANAKNGIGYGPKWLHMDGLSDQLFRYIDELEKVFPVEQEPGEDQSQG